MTSRKLIPGQMIEYVPIPAVHYTVHSPTGPTGSIGPVGPDGPMGSMGPMGPIGPTGTAGARGEIGDVGIKASSNPSSFSYASIERLDVNAMTSTNLVLYGTLTSSGDISGNYSLDMGDGNITTPATTSCGGIFYSSGGILCYGDVSAYSIYTSGITIMVNNDISTNSIVFSRFSTIISKNDIMISGVLTVRDTGIVSDGNVTTSGVTFLNTGDITVQGPVTCNSVTNIGTSAINSTTSGILCGALYAENGIITKTNIQLSNTYAPITGQLGYKIKMINSTNIVTGSTYPVYSSGYFGIVANTTSCLTVLKSSTTISPGTWIFNANLGFTLCTATTITGTPSGVTQIGVYLTINETEYPTPTTVSGVYVKSFNTEIAVNYSASKLMYEEVDITQIINNATTYSPTYYVRVFNGGDAITYNPTMSSASFTRIA